MHYNIIRIVKQLQQECKTNQTTPKENHYHHHHQGVMQLMMSTAKKFQHTRSCVDYNSSNSVTYVDTQQNSYQNNTTTWWKFHRVVTNFALRFLQLLRAKIRFQQLSS